MELSEDLRYRLAYLTLRLVLDRKLAAAPESTKLPGVLDFLDLLSGTQLAGQAKEAEGMRYLSQQDKLENFIDAEFGEEVLETVRRAVAELL